MVWVSSPPSRSWPASTTRTRKSAVRKYFFSDPSLLSVYAPSSYPPPPPLFVFPPLLAYSARDSCSYTAYCVRFFFVFASLWTWGNRCHSYWRWLYPGMSMASTAAVFTNRALGVQLSLHAASYIDRFNIAVEGSNALLWWFCGVAIFYTWWQPLCGIYH